MPARPFEWGRAARMGGFGLVLYGPGQHWWYGLLDRQFPLKQTPHFLAKASRTVFALLVCTHFLSSWCTAKLLPMK